MADIFISYSRKDSDHALSLAERLRLDGIEVWIDQRGIVGAEQWATEIVEGIRECSTFLLLISPDSVQSENVLKELSLASEARKRILPVDIHPTVLPTSFMYPLAGLQRVALTDYDGLVRAHKHGVIHVIAKDTRKSLMILPFEDLSPSQDNEWFANGIVSELINALSNVRALRLADNQATKEFKRYRGQLTTYASEMNIRYFVQGDVRKFGDQIKISARLLDIETGDHLWQDSMKGTMENIFDIQEEVAARVVDGLNIILTKQEKSKLIERGTENAEAYELFLKAVEYSARQTKEGFQLAVQLYSEAIKLDPGYANAYERKALSLANLFRSYNRDPALLDEGLLLTRNALRLRPNLWEAYDPLSMLLQLQGKLEEAEQVANDYIQSAPEATASHFALGFLYMEIGQFTKAIPPLERGMHLKMGNLASSGTAILASLWNLVVCCEGAKEEEKRRQWSEAAIPIFERHLRLFPDLEMWQVNHAVLLHFAGRDDDAREAARRLEDLKDGVALYTGACLQNSLGDHETGFKTFRKAIEAGFRNIPILRSYLVDEDAGVGRLKGTPEWEEVREMVEKLSEA